jgi:hypothetical protein
MKVIDLLNEAPIEMDPSEPNNPNIYGHEKANPMSLKGRIMQARAQLKDLAEMADSDELVVWEKITKLSKGGMFMGLEQNLEQIRHGIEELAKKRKKGGTGSRGIDPMIDSVEEGWKSKMAGAALAAANLLGSPAQAAEEPVKPITIAYVMIDGEVKKYDLGDRFENAKEAEKFISSVLDKQGLSGYTLDIKHGYPKKKLKDSNNIGETATAGATSAGSVASVSNPQSKPAKKGKYGAPEAPQHKNKDGTVKNALDTASNLMGSKPIKR